MKLKAKTAAMIVLTALGAAGTIATPASADGGAVVSGQIVKTNGAWAAIKGAWLKSTLEGWCREAGWDLIWDSSSDYEIGASAAFFEDFEGAVTHLIDSIYIDNPEITATLYRGNKVLHIEEHSLTSN